MPIDLNKARKLLQEFDFRELFNEFGWDHHRSTLEITINGQLRILQSVAHKRGMVVYHAPTPIGEQLPEYAIRRKIDQQVVKTSYEHIIIFTDLAQATQIWQWVKHEPGKPAACREHHFYKQQLGEALLQKLQSIAFSLDEEETLTLTDVTRRTRAGFDVERVTKGFYEQFKKEHGIFFEFITGIPEVADHEWYTSIMLNRLMFVYFIQKKGFLDGDHDYLRNRLAKTGKEHGKDKFYSFYRYFLLRLFHEGLGGKQRTTALEKLIGKIPYLNGGLFEKHEVERRYPDIQIPDKAFEKLFDYFDQYQWHLDERPLRDDREINPDVLGYIFEKYINQKQMGAYYTKEDITEYIGKSAIIPFLFDAARPKCKVAFENPDGPTIWDHLKADPDRYIYPAVRHGADKPLPPEIEIGVDVTMPNLIERRKGWNKPAPAGYALPTEIWREVAARRKRYGEVREKLANGEVHDINDLITLNLDLRQFAQDVIENCEGPELLRVLWHSIEKVTVLDPTCGSGAFLFAALNILEPLYEACLDRMEVFLADESAKLDKGKLKTTQHGYPLLPHGKMEDFSKLLDRVASHPNRRYFIFKSIILNNLYGVDIMEEAVEICKLRLFLKLAAQVEPDHAKPNYGIEPLPDIDFNIRAGNTLVGFASMAEIRHTLETDLLNKPMLETIEAKAKDADCAFQLFHKMQTEEGMDAKEFITAKKALREKLKALNNELDHYLARNFGVDPLKKQIFDKWRNSHQPFHWLVEFYGIINRGGFDVIVGNPPYLEQREITYEMKGFASLESGAVHAVCIERSAQLLHRGASMSMIVPLALPSTQRMKVVQDIIERDRDAWYSNFSWRPGKLFDTVNRALTIFVAIPAGEGHTFSTGYQKWTSDDRAGLFERLNYINVPRKRPAFWIPKVGEEIESAILEKCLKVKTVLNRFTSESQHRVYYRTDGGLYWKVFTDFAPAFRANGKAGHSTRETWFTLSAVKSVHPVIAALSSDIFWWWYSVTSNCRHLNPYDVQNFPLPESAVADPMLAKLGKKYLDDLAANSTMLLREQKQTGKTETQSFKISKSKPIIDEIDHVLAKHYGLTEEEIDFIVNYDIKYRMGREAEAEEE